MLGDANIYPTIPVKDLDRAKEFYGQTLGLKQVGEDPGGIIFQSGNTKLYVYTSEYAGTNKATTASWLVKDTPEMAKALAEKGVVFEQYDDIPGMTRDGDIHTMGDIRAAWFKDPDGNILAFDDSPTMQSAS